MKADYMQCKHLGTDQYFLGSVIAYLAMHVMGSTMANNIGTIFDEVKQYYQDNKVTCRFQNMTVNMIKGNSKKAVTSSFPKLSGKAAEVKHLVLAMVHVWTKHMDATNAMHKQVLLGLKASA
eukprot:14298758-Alexandrium_andersonii.AAC.1